MATTATLDHTQVRVKPRSFTPPGDRPKHRAVRLSHLDPRPLWYEAAVAQSPWRSPTFWVAYALCAPIAGVAKLLRR